MAQREQMVRGVVEALNDRGLKLNGTWFNWSKFSEVTPPTQGEEVELLVKDGKWIAGCSIVGGGGGVAVGRQRPQAQEDTFGAPDGDDDPGAWGYGQAPAAPAPARAARPAAPMPQAMAPAPVAKGGRASLRAAALAASAHFHSGNPSADEEAVYDTATRFLAWIDDEA